MVALAPNTKDNTKANPKANTKPRRATPVSRGPLTNPNPNLRTPPSPCGPDEELRRAITAAQILRGARHAEAATRADEIMTILRLGVELSEEERSIINDAIRSV